MKGCRVSITVPSRLDHLDLVQGLAEEVGRLAGLEDDACLDLGLAVREGAVNAMKHAHALDPARPVLVLFDHADSCVQVSVIDQGQGFDPESLPDPRTPENLLRTSGRGLFLIRSLVDEVRFVQRTSGMELIMTKRCASQDGKAATS